MTPWVLRLIIANVVVFALQQLRPALTDTFAFVPALFLIRPWTIFTYMFLHGDVGHILFNMLGLFFFGPRLEDLLGAQRFLILYVVSGMVGALLSFFSPFTGIIGASGATYGVFMGFAYFWPRERILVMGVVPVEARWFVVVMTIISLLGGFGASPDGVAHFAHLGGFLGGFLCLKALERSARAAQMARNVVLTATSHGDVERWKKIPRERLHEVNRAELDRLLEKIEKSGVASLSQGEREFLDRFSEG
jgi:membrane associated rhomboid family serine protease